MTLSTGVVVDDQALTEVCRRFEVLELAVFGSFARGDDRPDSDIDILVEFAPGARIGLWKFGELEAELSSLFGRKVDLVSKRGLKPRIRPYVLRDARILYAA